jgi:hypothetical protein
MRKREPMEVMVEREACAAIAERFAANLINGNERVVVKYVADMIRARSGEDDDHGRIK